MTILAVDVETERMYRATARSDHDRWWAWLEDITAPSDPKTMHITRVLLGEGSVTLTRFRYPIEVVGDECVTFDETWPAPKPPPCWPSTGDVSE